jgi:hypothetical protein
MRWTPGLRIIILLATATPAALIAAQWPTGLTPEAMPKVAFAETYYDGKRPVWSDASLLVGNDGKARRDIAEGYVADSVDELLSRPSEGGCVHVLAFIHEYITQVHRESLRQAVATSELILFGRVEDRSFGFWGPESGQLLRIVPSEVLREASWTEPQAEYFLFVPLGTFQLGKTTICKEEPSYANPPGIGDEIVVLFPANSRTDRRLLFSYDAGSLITLPREGRVTLPGLYEHEATGAMDSSALKSRLRSLVQEVPMEVLY